jgi:hypothetical protein
MENGIDWGFPMGVALKFWAIHVAVLCGAVHRDAVTLVIDKPGEEKKNILQSCSDISLSGGI